MLFRNNEYFLAIVEEGSLTRAAEKLYISQPSLSQYLKRLETTLGVELFDHSSSPLKLTYTGELYYRHVLDEKKADDALMHQFETIRNQEGSSIRLGIALWRGACFLPEIFPEFHRKYPSIHIELHEGNSQKLEADLMNNRTDIAVLNLHPSMNYEKMTCLPIFDEKILLAVPTENDYVRKLLQNCPWKDGYPVCSLEILNHIPFISSKSRQNITHTVDYVLSKYQMDVKPILYTENLTTAINLVEKGVGCVFVPEEGSHICQRAGHVTYLWLDNPDLIWSLGLMYRKGSYIPKLVQTFIDEVMDYFHQKYQRNSSAPHHE